jgi:hypothetical protein
MNWLQACKEWNRRKGGKYEVPKKGTAGYNEVRKLMGKSPTKGKGKGQKVGAGKRKDKELRELKAQLRSEGFNDPADMRRIDEYFKTEMKDIKKAPGVFRDKHTDDQIRKARNRAYYEFINYKRGHETTQTFEPGYVPWYDRRFETPSLSSGELNPLRPEDRPAQEWANAKGKPKKGGFLPLLTAGLTALPSIISLFKGNGKRMEMSAQHLVDDMVGAGLIGGTHKSQYVRWLLGRVRGNREGEVKKPDADDWGSKDDVYRRPYPKDTKRRPDARANPLDTEYAGWRPEDWDGRHPPFKAETVKTRSKFIQALLPTEKKAPAEDTSDKKKYKLNPSLRKFPGITSKQMVDFRTRVGSKRSQNTFGELTNMGQFFGDEDFLNKYDTAEKLEPFVKEWEKVKGTRKPKEWYAENASFVVETDVPSVVIKRKAKSAEKPAEAPKPASTGKEKLKEAMLALKTARDALPTTRQKATLTQRVRYYEQKGLPYEDAIYKALETGKKK